MSTPEGQQTVETLARQWLVAIVHNEPEGAEKKAHARTLLALVATLTQERDERLTLDESRTLAFKVTDAERKAATLRELAQVVVTEHAVGNPFLGYAIEALAAVLAAAAPTDEPGPSPRDDRPRLHQALGVCWCDAQHTLGQALALNNGGQA